MAIIPRTMGTQHPDNVASPKFLKANGSHPGVLSRGEEIAEALWFYNLGGAEQMWDFEGKVGDNQVVFELFSQAHDFFKKNPLGKEKFLTIRIPNPFIEKDDSKILMEVLESIARFRDVAKVFFGEDAEVPVFEVILPMATSAEELHIISTLYSDFVAGKQDAIIAGTELTVGDILGDYRPKSINVIPLFESMEAMLNADKIVARYREGLNLEYQRVFLARSDPALNYGSLAAVLLLNIALLKLHRLQKDSIPIYPILGVGSPAFRGNFKPTTTASMLAGYPSCATFTVQSAFKYDWPEFMVKEAINLINSSDIEAPLEIDIEKSVKLIEKIVPSYQAQIGLIAPLVNSLSEYIPRRRLRRQHTGLFGYSRKAGEVKLPRVINFCASLYSIGLPPEIFGLHVLDRDDLRVVGYNYPNPNFQEDMREALAYFNPECFGLIDPRLKDDINKAIRIVDFEMNKEHALVTSEIVCCLKRGQTDGLNELIEEAGRVRRFLG